LLKNAFYLDVSSELQINYLCLFSSDARQEIKLRYLSGYFVLLLCS
jgi:hypothetical protein